MLRGDHIGFDLLRREPVGERLAECGNVSEALEICHDVGRWIAQIAELAVVLDGAGWSFACGTDGCFDFISPTLSPVETLRVLAALRSDLRELALQRLYRVKDDESCVPLRLVDGELVEDYLEAIRTGLY